MWALFLTIASLAATPNSYTEVNSVESERVIQSITKRSFSSLSTEAEQVEWVRARMAGIALARLRGQESQALDYFIGCETYCQRHAPEKEWATVKAWGCTKKKEAKICLPKSTSKTTNTKAQKPPH